MILWAIARFCGAHATSKNGEKAVQILGAKLATYFPKAYRQAFQCRLAAKIRSTGRAQ
jgi:hypothetical protein